MTERHELAMACNWCGEWFDSTTAFAAHRDGYSRCRNPTFCGLSLLVTRDGSVWTVKDAACTRG